MIIATLYQSETAPTWIRGIIVGSYQLSVGIGLLLAAVVNNTTHNRDDTGSYRIPIAIQFTWAIILITGMIILPETPRYLIKQRKQDKALQSLAKIRRLPESHTAVIEELAEIQVNYRYELSLGNASYLDCFKGNIGIRLMTGCVLQGLQQLTGINFIFYYGTQFFKNTGIKDPFVIGLTTNLVNVFSTLPGLVLVEKWGRRPLLLFGAIGMCICEFIIAIVGVTAESEIANKILIAFVCFYIFFFAFSWGPVGWSLWYVLPTYHCVHFEWFLT